MFASKSSVGKLRAEVNSLTTLVKRQFAYNKAFGNVVDLLISKGIITREEVTNAIQAGLVKDSKPIAPGSEKPASTPQTPTGHSEDKQDVHPIEGDRNNLEPDSDGKK